MLLQQILWDLHAFLLRWNNRWGFNTNVWIPFSWWQDSYLIKKLVNSVKQVSTIACLVCNVMEDLNIQSSDHLSKY
jgi:hypothetical protein